MKHASPAAKRESGHGSAAADDLDAARTVVCTACPMLCDDIVPAAGRVENACDFGAAAIAAIAAAGSDPVEAWDADGPVPLDAALDRAAGLLAAARRVLVTGLAAATLEDLARACDLAEWLGAAIDAGTAETSQPAGPTIARVGEVTAAWEELRDRADLVVFWFHDPATTHPRFIERFLPPAAGRTGRRTISIGPDPVLAAGPAHRHLRLSGDHAVEAARLLHARLAGLPVAGRPETMPTAKAGDAAVAATELESAMRAAGCVAIVTGERVAAGLEPWSIAHVTRILAHERSAFCVPLAAGIGAGGANVAGVAAISTWRYGAAGAIARADRAGGVFLPGEAAAGRLIERDEVDCVLAVGPLTAAAADAIRRRRQPLAVVQLAADPTGPDIPSRATIRIRCGSRTDAAGTMLREDGRRVVLPPRPAAARVRPLDEVLAGLAERVRRSTPARTGGAAS